MRAYKAKEMAQVEAAQAKISILMNLYEVSAPFVAAIKGAVARMGVPIVPAVKDPAADLTDEQQQRIKTLLVSAGVIPADKE